MRPLTELGSQQFAYLALGVAMIVGYLGLVGTITEGILLPAVLQAMVVIGGFDLGRRSKELDAV